MAMLECEPSAFQILLLVRPRFAVVISPKLDQRAVGARLYESRNRAGRMNSITKCSGSDSRPSNKMTSAVGPPIRSDPAFRSLSVLPSDSTIDASLGSLSASICDAVTSDRAATISLESRRAAAVRVGPTIDLLTPLGALDHHLPRVREDHDNARRLAAGLTGIEGLSVEHAATRY